MKSYGLDMQGPLIIERVDELPTWISDFEGRIIYLTSDDSLYIATSTKWSKLITAEDIPVDPTGLVGVVKYLVYMGDNCYPVTDTLKIINTDGVLGLVWEGTEVAGENIFETEDMVCPGGG